MSVSINH